MDPNASPRLRSFVELRSDEVRGTAVLLLPERVVWLNVSAAAILALCDGARTTGDIVADIEQRFGPPDEDIRADVMAFLETASRRRWLR